MREGERENRKQNGGVALRGEGEVIMEEEEEWEVEGRSWKCLKLSVQL